MDSSPHNEIQQAGRGNAQTSPHDLLSGASFTAKDLALCSSDEARAFIPWVDALALQALPLGLLRQRCGMSLHVAASDNSKDTESKVRFACGIDVSITKVPSEILEQAIPLAYLGSDTRLREYVDKISIKGPHKERQATRQQWKPSGDAAKFITALLEFAAVRGASDLHLAPTEAGAVIKMRIDGELLIQEDNLYAKTFHEQVVSRLKVLASLDIASRLVPHDGAFSFSVGNSVRHARLSVLPTIYGESVVVRFLHARSIPQVSMLGVEPAALLSLRSAMERAEGLILLTGPTGSGKTTTMYAVVVELERRGRNVVTVEDPVEVPIPGIVQVQVALEQGLDFQRAFRSVLRHDPDVLLIGEMRDSVSASMAIDAATSGHVTISSVHVGSVLYVLNRLEVLGVPRARSVPSLTLVLNQRLLPRLCPTCKVKDHISGEKEDQGVFRSLGCSGCHGSGYQGRVLVTEALDLQSRGAKEACYKAESAADLLRFLPEGAFIPWMDSLQYHLARGDISLRQVEEFLSQEV